MNFDKPYEDFCKINYKIITKVLTHNTIQSQNYKFDKRDGEFDRKHMPSNIGNWEGKFAIDPSW